MEDLVKKAKKIIEESVYITIASSSNDGSPWVSPVYSGHDEKYNFYFSSNENSQHVKFIKKNNQIMFVIFNSMVSRGEGTGVYMQATVHELTTEQEIRDAYTYFYGRNDAKPHEPSYYLGGSERKLYKVVPTIAWINSWEKVNGVYTDTRIEVPILKD